MNKKQAIVLVAVLLSSFIGGVFAAQNVPAIQQVFVTNFPKNQNVTVTNPTSQSRTIQTLSVTLTVGTGVTTYPVAGWRTVSIYLASSAGAVSWGFITLGVQQPECIPTPPTPAYGFYTCSPSLVLNTGGSNPITFLTVQVQGEQVYFQGNSSPNTIVLFLQK